MDFTAESLLPQNWSGYTERQKELYNALEPKGFKIDVYSFPETRGKTIILDVEHDEDGNFVCCGLLCVGDNTVHVTYDISNLRLCSFDGVSLIAHNGHSDLELLRGWGIDVKDEQLVHDTELYAHILQSDLHEYGLKSLAERYLGIVYPSYDDIVGRRTKKQKNPRCTLDKQPRDLVARYNAWDCWATGKLYEDQTKRLTDRDRQYFEIVEKPCAPIFGSMEARGIRLDLGKLRALEARFQTEIDSLQSEIQAKLGEINLNAPKQVLNSFASLDIKPIFRGKPSLDKRGSLYTKFSQNPVVKQYQRWNTLSTLQDSFVRAYLNRGTEYAHPFFNQCGTRTGRPSCSNPNLLQIPKRSEDGRHVRAVFSARPGMLLGDCDYRTIEPRVLAHLSANENMLGMFNEGVDFHSYFAEHLKVTRDTAKIFDLEVYYRATKYGVSRTLECSLFEAKKYISEAWDLFPGLREWEDKLIWEAKRSGYVTTLMGRRIPIDGLTHQDPFKKEHAKRQAMNNLIQGSAAEVMKLGMQKVYQGPRLSKSFGLLIQVYDQLIFESAEMESDIQYAKEDMEKAVTLSVPLEVEAKTGSNWAELAEV